MTVAVVADSAADLSPALVRDLPLHVIPLVVSFGEESFRDGDDLAAEAFWERVARVEGDRSAPQTASPPPAAFTEAYEEAARAGARGIVSVHLSGELSRTVQTAAAAARAAPVPAEVVDSRSVSLGEGLAALAAARAAARGSPLEEVASVARDAARRVETYALLDTVEFLRRGGRVGAARAALSDLLRIRPLLTLEDGVPALAARARTRARAIEEMLRRARGPAEAAAVIHSGAREAEELRERLGEACGVQPLVALVGAAMGSHLGPRALGVVVMRPRAEPARAVPPVLPG